MIGEYTSTTLQELLVTIRRTSVTRRCARKCNDARCRPTALSRKSARCMTTHGESGASPGLWGGRARALTSSAPPLHPLQHWTCADLTAARAALQTAASTSTARTLRHRASAARAAGAEPRLRRGPSRQWGPRLRRSLSSPSASELGAHEAPMRGRGRGLDRRLAPRSGESAVDTHTHHGAPGHIFRGMSPPASDENR